jgi:hypothetical protein
MEGSVFPYGSDFTPRINRRHHGGSRILEESHRECPQVVNGEDSDHLAR